MALDPAKLRNLSGEELEREEQELRDEIWKLRLQGSTGQLPDPHKVRKTRKDLARVLTVRREQERGVPPPAAKSEGRRGSGARTTKKAGADRRRSG